MNVENSVSHTGYRGAVAILSVLVLAAATFLFQLFEVRTFLDAGEQAEDAAAEVALEEVANRFLVLQNEMEGQARALATHPQVIRGLRQFSEDRAVGQEIVVRTLAAMAPGDLEGYEIYSQEPRLVGWTGATLPLDSAPEEGAFLRGMQSRLVDDGPGQKALSLWVPIRDGSSILGAVRVVRVIERRFQVRNEFLKDYALEEELSRLTGLTVRLDAALNQQVNPL